MANIKVRHLINRNGCYYWQPSTSLRRLGWQPKRLPATLEAAIAEAEKINMAVDKWRHGVAENVSVPVMNSIDSLITAYKKSKNYRKLKENTKEDYDYRLELIAKWAGQVPLEGITRKSVQDFWEKLAKKSEWKANATIRVLRLLFNYAIDLEMIKVNPATRPGLVDIKQRSTVWDLEIQEEFIKVADRLGYFNIGTAIMLSAFIAQREGDILNLSWQDCQNGAFQIRQHKTGTYIRVPIHPILRARLMQYTNHDGLIIKNDLTGLRYSKNAFTHRFDIIRREVVKKYPEAKDYKFLDLRRTAIVRLAEAGCTEAQISAVSGHKIETCRRILEVYLPRNSTMAAAAIDKYTAYLPAA